MGPSESLKQSPIPEGSGPVQPRNKTVQIGRRRQTVHPLLGSALDDTTNPDAAGQKRLAFELVGIANGMPTCEEFRTTGFLLLFPHEYRSRVLHEGERSRDDFEDWTFESIPARARIKHAFRLFGNDRSTRALNDGL